MNLFRFDIDFDDFNDKEQLEISRDADELCCRAIEDITGINRMAFKTAKRDECRVAYSWRNVYIFSLNNIFNVPAFLISKLTNYHPSTVCNICTKVSESKEKEIRERINRIHSYINKHY